MNRLNICSQLIPICQNVEMHKLLDKTITNQAESELRRTLGARVLSYKYQAAVR
jgi:hypothetical protein